MAVQYTWLWDYKQEGWGPHVIFGPEVILYSVNCLILDKLYQPIKLCSCTCPRNVPHISVVGTHQWAVEEFLNLGGKENLRVEMGKAASFLLASFKFWEAEVCFVLLQHQFIIWVHLGRCMQFSLRKL